MSTKPYNDDKRLLELLERWQSGDFTRADELELQALADSDEFRREAVEGFWSTPEEDHASHLAVLRKRLKTRIGGGKRIALPQIMLAAAAIFILVLAVVWVFPTEQKLAPLAQNEVAPAPSEQPAASENAVQNNSAEPEGISSTSAGKSKPAPGTFRSSEPEPVLAAPTAGAGPDLAMEKATDTPASDYAIQESTADKAVAAKPVISDNESNVFSDEADDVDYRQGNMGPIPKAKKQDAAANEQAAKRKKAPAQAKAAGPEGGWTAFQEYLRRNARLPEAARQQNISGTVRLKFKLDSNAQPVDFQVINPLGFGCEEEAIRLVKAYNWQLGSNSEISVDVPFVR